MKRKHFWIALLAIIPAAFGAFGLAACGDTEEATAPPYGGHEGPSIPEEGTPPADDSIVLDGKLEETDWADAAWGDWTTVGTKGDELGSTAVQVRATTVYGKEGVYLAFDVSHTPVFADLTHTRELFYDSAISPYFGIPGTSQNYESYITADGAIGTKAYTGGNFVDSELVGYRCATTIKNGEVNTLEADGYVIEAYLPWSAFHLDSAPAAIYMDIAVITSEDNEASGRAGWESLGKSHKQGWSWATPNSYWYWGNGGFESSVLSAKIDDYDANGGSVTFDKTVYEAFDDVTVELQPAQGYLLSSIKVNGREMRDYVKDNKLVLANYCGDLDLVVSVEFGLLPTDAVTISGTAHGYAGASEDWLIPEGTTIVFAGKLVYEAEVGAYGAYSVELAPGEYEVSADGFVTQTVNIAEGGTNNLRFRWKLIEETSNYTVSADESEAYVTAGGKWQSATINTLSERFSFSYTIKMTEGKGIGDYDNMGLRVFFGEGNANSYLIQMLVYSGNLYAKITKEDSTDAIGGETQLTDSILTVQEFLENGAKVMILGNGGTLTYFICDAEGCWHKISEVSDIIRITLMNWTPNAYFDDISYCDGEDPVKYTVGGKVTVHGGTSGNWLLPAGTELSFTGPTVTTATLGADGSYTAQLSLGSYSVTAAGCEPVAITVTGAGTQNISAAWKLFNSSNAYTQSQGGASIRPTIKNGSVGMNFLSDKFVLRYTLKPQSEKTIADVGRISLIGYAGETSYAFTLYDFNTTGSGHQLFADIKENNSMMAGSQASITNGKKWITVDEFNQNGIELLLVRNGTSFDYYAQDSKGVWQKIFTLADKSLTGWQLLCTETGAEMTDISYVDGLDGLNIRLDAQATNGSVELDGVYKLGGNVVLKLTPSENCILKSIFVDGVDKTADVHENKLTIQAYMRLEMTVEATFEEHVETYAVSGSATASAGASKAWSIPDGTELTFTNSRQIVTKTTVSGGRYSAQLAAGTYTVTAEGYSSVTAEIEGEETENIVLRYTLLGTSDYWTVGENDTSAKASVNSDGGKWLPIHTGRGTFTLIYRVKGVDGAATANDAMTDGAGYFVVSDTYSDGSRGYQCGYIDNGYALRMTNEWSGNYGLSITAEHYANNGVWVMLICENGTVKAYYKLNTADAWTVSSIHDLVLAENAVCTLYTWNPNVCFDNISYEPYLPEVTVETSVTSTEETGSIAVEPLRYGGTLKITASPADGYQLTSIKVNGTEHIGDVLSDVLTIENFREFTATVAATFSLIPKDLVTVSGKVTAVGGTSEAWAVPAETQLIFTGDTVGQATVGADGSYSVKLAVGEYTVTAAEHLSGTLTVEGEASDKNIQLRWKLFGTSEFWTVSEENGTASASENSKEVALNLPKSDFVLKYRVKGGIGASVSNDSFKDGSGVTVYGSFDSNNNRGYQCGFIDDGYALRMTNEWSGNYKLSITAEEFASNGISVMLVRKGTTLKSYYLLGSSDQWNVCAIKDLTLPEDVHYTIYSWNKDVVIADMEFALGNALLNVKIDIGTFANGSVTAEKDVYQLGETVQLNIAPVAEYDLVHLYVNDVDLVGSVSENKLTLENNMKLELRIRAEFEKPQSVQISGAAKAVAGANGAWSIPDDTELTFTKGGSEGVTATVTGGGTYSVELLTGTYTVTAKGYLPLRYAVTAGGEGKDITLRWDLIAEADTYTVDENETQADAKAANSAIDVNLTEGDFVLFATYKLKSGSLETYEALGGNGNGAKYSLRTIQFVSSDGVAANNVFASYYRYYNNSSSKLIRAYLSKNSAGGPTTAAGAQHNVLTEDAYQITDEEFTQTGMRTMCVLKGTTFSFYIKPTSGTNAEQWVLVGTIENVSGFSKAVLQGSGSSNRRFADISYYRGTEEFDKLGLED